MPALRRIGSSVMQSKPSASSSMTPKPPCRSGASKFMVNTSFQRSDGRHGNSVHLTVFDASLPELAAIAQLAGSAGVTVNRYDDDLSA